VGRDCTYFWRFDAEKQNSFKEEEERRKKKKKGPTEDRKK